MTETDNNIKADNTMERLTILEARVYKLEMAARRRRLFRYLGWLIILIYVGGLAWYFYRIYTFAI